MNCSFVFKLIAVELHSKVGTVERSPGFGIGAFQKHTFGIGLAGDDSLTAGFAKGCCAHLVIGAVGQQNHSVAGICLSIERIIKGYLGFTTKINFRRSDYLFCKNRVVGQSGGDASNLNRYRNGCIPLSELNAHRRQNPVFCKIESLRQGIATEKDGTCPPYSTHHWHTDNAGNDIGLDKPLNTGDHQRIIDLQTGPGGVLTVRHLHNTVAVAGLCRHREGGGNSSGIIADKIAGHDTPVTAQDNA